MKISLSPGHRPIAIAAVGLFCVTLIAWNHEPVYQSGDITYYQDTVPAKSFKTSELRDLDKELEKLDRAIERLENMKGKNWDEVSGRLQEQLGRINLEEVIRQTELAMKNIDLNKIRLDAQVDLNKINIESQKVLKEIDIEIIQKQVNEVLSSVNIDTDAIQKAMSEVKIEFDEVKIELNKELAELKAVNTEVIKEAMAEVRIELQKAKAELKANQLDFKKELDNATNDIQAAKKELSAYQDMIYSMEKDGLLDTKKDYKIVHREGSVYINDKKQSDSVSAKYKLYLKENITIKKDNGRFNINSDHSNFD